MKLTGVMTVTKRGRTFTYLRRKGLPLVRLPDLPHDHPDFLAAYAAARQTGPAIRQRHATGSIGAMAQAAMASDTWLSFSRGYRTILIRHIDAIRADVGPAPLAGLRAKHIRKNVADSTAQVGRLKTWRFLCNFAVNAGLIEADPCFGVKPPRQAATTGHPPWTPADIAAYRARWPIGTTRRAAMELLYWTGARISDAVLIGPGMVDRAGVLTFRQVKTKSPAYIPWTCPLPDYARGLLTDRDMMHAALACMAGHMTWLATEQGRSRSDKSLGGDIRDAARAAGIARSAHGLRKSRAIALAESGATPHQIGAWTGHQTLKEITAYASQLDRRSAVMGTVVTMPNPEISKAI